MYNVNLAQIERRLAYIKIISDTAAHLTERMLEDAVGIFAAERAIHLAAECITDIGNYIIDGFVMRDASSYEDIVDIMQGESVFNDDLYAVLMSIVRLRKPLVQDYDRLNLDEVKRVVGLLPQGMTQFEEAIRLYLKQELWT
jgi:uncharacterized protein YutE (UPF0331/DUF86 family)